MKKGTEHHVQYAACHVYTRGKEHLHVFACVCIKYLCKNNKKLITLKMPLGRGTRLAGGIERKTPHWLPLVFFIYLNQFDRTFE